MAETKFTHTQDMIKCCNDTIDFLFDLNYQLAQVIEAKNKLYTKANTELNFSQCQEISASKNNLENIRSALPAAISDINQLVQQIPELTQKRL